MAHKTVPDEMLHDLNKEQSPKKAVRHVTKAIQAVKSRITPFGDTVVLLCISILYFFFTGLALLLNRKLPRKWMQIGYDLNAGRIAKKIEDTKENHIAGINKMVRKSYKVVDLETKKAVGLRVEPIKKT